MAGITLERVSKRFADGTVAVRDVSLEIHPGELFVLVGPSGCGKSTLLNLIVGLDAVSAGDIHVDGRIINDLDPKDRNMAMVFQSYALYPHMTVRENLAFPLKLAKRPRAEIHRRVQEVAALLELDALLQRRPATLSGGQRQRVAMGRAIVRQPAAFLMDEPLSNLDAQLRTQMRHEIAQLQRRLGVTMVYVTHDQTEAMTLADRMAVLRQGAVQQVGTPRELYQRPANRFIAEFIGMPSINLLPAQVLDGRVQLPMLTLPIDAAPARAKDCANVLAGVRAEHFLPCDMNPGLPHFTARVTFTEWLGAEQYAYFDHSDISADTQCLARLSGESSLRSGDPLDLSIDPRHIHWFDGDSGRRL